MHLHYFRILTKFEVILMMKIFTELLEVYKTLEGINEEQLLLYHKNLIYVFVYSNGDKKFATYRDIGFGIITQP